VLHKYETNKKGQNQQKESETTKTFLLKTWFHTELIFLKGEFFHFCLLDTKKDSYIIRKAKLQDSFFCKKKARQF